MIIKLNQYQTVKLGFEVFQKFCRRQTPSDVDGLEDRKAQAGAERNERHEAGTDAKKNVLQDQVLMENLL